MHSTPHITTVPAHEDDLVRRACVNGFTLTEAWSPPRKIPAHAHASLSITVVLGGAFEEVYRPIQGAHDCRPGSLLVRPAGEIHENNLGRQGARTLSLELSPGRLELYGKELAPILSLAARREAAFLDIGLAMSRELLYQDVATPLALESLTLELLARLVRIGQSMSYRPLHEDSERSRRGPACFDRDYLPGWSAPVTQSTAASAGNPCAWPIWPRSLVFIRSTSRAPSGTTSAPRPANMCAVCDWNGRYRKSWIRQSPFPRLPWTAVSQTRAT